MIDRYVKDVIDPEISFTPTVTLQKKENFYSRIFKLLVFQNILFLITVGFSLIQFFLFYNMNEDQ
jgi:hypothetical protein